MIDLDEAIFRAYDIRGIVDKNLNEQIIFLIGQALGSLALEKQEQQLIIGRDGRLSGSKLSQALSAGILSTGCDVIDIGMVPTPLLYYAAQIFDGHSGAMLTGSHNPWNYNGLKMMVQGGTLIEEEIKDLYQRILAKRFLTGQGKYRLYETIEEDYLIAVTNNVHLKRPLKIVVDAGNGISGRMAPKLFHALGCEVYELFCDIDGQFPHHHPDPGQPENLQDLIRTVQEKDAAIGLAFDGDGDRLGVVTRHGKIIWPDRLLMLFAKAVLHDHPRAKIIYDVKCSDHLATFIHSLQGEPMMWKTGHSLIKAKLVESKAKLAGEMSGHFFFNDRWYGFDDALYAGARLLEILSQEVIDSDALFATLPDSINTPELKVFIEENEKFSLMQKLIDQVNFLQGKKVTTIDGLRVNFNDGWGLIRPSNTTPYLVLRFEATNEIILKNIQMLFREWMLSVKPDLILPF